MSGTRKRTVPIGGAPRAIVRSRTAANSRIAGGPGPLRRVKSSVDVLGALAVAPNSAGVDVPGKEVAALSVPGADVLQLRNQSRSDDAVSVGAGARPQRTPASSGVRDSNGSRRLAASYSEPSLAAAVVAPAAASPPPVPDLMAGAKMQKLNAEAATLPPWSCPLNENIRYQPTTLIWKVHKIPKGVVAAAKALDARRYQPTSVDHGLFFRLRDAKPGGPTATLERLSGKDRPIPPREGVPTPSVGKIHYPTWWGGPGGVGGERPTYEDFGCEYAEQGIPKERFDQHPVSSESLPLLNGRYDHQNPFIAQFARRGPGGLIVCDVSTCTKSGPNQRDPTLGRGR